MSAPRLARRLAAGVVALTLAAPGVSRAQGEPAPAPDTLTVAECVALARRQAPALAAAALDERAAASDSAASSFNRRPEFFLSAGAWLAPEWSYDPSFTDLGQYHAQLGMNWTLADGGRRERVRERARLDLEGARARRSQASRDAGESVASLAFQSLRLREVGEILGETRERLDGIGLLVRAGVRSGTRSPADSIRLGFTEQDVLFDLETNFAAAVAAELELLDAMGRGLDRSVVVRMPDPADVRAPAAADSLALLAAAAARPEVALARVEETQARIEMLEAGKRNAPAVDLSLDAGLAGTDLTRAVPPSLLDEDPSAAFPDRLRRDLGASAAVTIHVPVLDPARAPATRAREDVAHAAEARRGAELLRQQRISRVLFSHWRSAAERRRLAEAVVARAESHFLRTKSLYAAGATTLFDLLDSLQLLKEARVRRAEAREDLRMVRFQIEERL